MNKASMVKRLGNVSVIEKEVFVKLPDSSLSLDNENFVSFCNSHFNDSRQIFTSRLVSDNLVFVLFQGFLIYTVIEGDKKNE
jgi:hypothetical protein